jgi:hypothetical protein
LQTPFNFNKFVAMTPSEIIREINLRKKERLEKRQKTNKENADIMGNGPHLRQVSILL